MNMYFSEYLGKVIFKRMREKEIDIYKVSEITLFTCDDILRICCGELIISPNDLKLVAQALETTKEELISEALKADWKLIENGELPEQDGTYLVTIDKSLDGIPYTTEVKYIFNEWVFPQNIDAKIIAWMKCLNHIKRNRKGEK